MHLGRVLARYTLVSNHYQTTHEKTIPAHDLYHDAVKNALIKDGWTITHDPFRMEWGKRDMYVDLGAERLLAAERAGERIAVEVKSFLGASDIADLEQALGQFILYHDV